jgi:aspartyl-tRNA(Asn)/glutamyl-tRNA(Gln) amidotransferase subunit B
MANVAHDKYEVVIGLEVHAQLLTNSKIFSGEATRFGEDPNRQVSVITLAHPGVLPKLNKRAIELAVKMGFACDSEISRYQIFDRKNYFYPDLPKGYQLTQDRTPICKGGQVKVLIEGAEVVIPLNRIHLEEDAGKLLHLENENDSLVDFNRAGVALIEIVTEPAIKSAEEAGAFLSEVRKLVRYLDICDGNMEEGSLRCDANVSVREKGETALGKKVEIKNMNSVRNVQRAIICETERQILLLESGKEIVSETRTFDADKAMTYAMRTKEELNDYRYFPDPDLSPLQMDDHWLAQIKSSMPALPRALFEKFVSVYALPAYDAHILTETKEMAAYFESVCEHTANFKAASNWLMGPVKSHLNEKDISITAFPLAPETISKVITFIESGLLNFAAASQRLLPELIRQPAADVKSLAEQLNLIQDSNADTMGSLINEIIREFPLKVEEYKKGKKGIVAMFMGEVMKRSKGKADPKVATSLLTQKLNEIIMP